MNLGRELRVERNVNPEQVPLKFAPKPQREPEKVREKEKVLVER
jgi:hypothetical protein